MATFRTRIYRPGGNHLRITLSPATSVYEGGVKVGDKPGVHVEFTNGEFVTDDKKVIERLRSLPTFGRDFHEVTDEDLKAEQKQNASKKASDETGNDAGDQNDPRAELEKLTKQELQNLAEKRGVTLDANLKKAEIIDAILNAQK